MACNTHYKVMGMEDTPTLWTKLRAEMFKMCLMRFYFWRNGKPWKII